MHFDDFCQNFQRRINSFLDEILPNAAQNTLHQAMRYATLNNGKRLRPLFVYATGLAFNAEAKTLDILAAAVEIIHCYSLIHDDLPAMDNSDLRRGLPSCHKKFDEANAILAGDALFAFSFEVLSQKFYPTHALQNQMIAILSTASLQMAEGQAQDIANQTITSCEELDQINQLKTGALIEASILLGAIAANCQNKAILHELKQYARHVGLAFQISDDILDVESNPEALGKPTQHDQKLNKPTYPAIIGLDGAKQKLQQLLTAADLSLKKLNLEKSFLNDLATSIINRQR